MTAAYDDFIARESDYRIEAQAAKREILEFNLASELADLTALARDLAAASVATRDLGEDSLRRPTIEVMVALRVYRSYVTAHWLDALDRPFPPDAADVARPAVCAPAAVDLHFSHLPPNVKAPLARPPSPPFLP